MAPSLKLKQPDEMDFSNSGEKTLLERWRGWRHTIELYISLAMPAHQESEKCAAVLYIIGQDGRDIYSTWTNREETLKGLPDGFEK